MLRRKKSIPHGHDLRLFSLYEHDDELAKVLRNMTSLRSLTLGDRGSVSNLMDGCTFALKSLSCFCDIDESLQGIADADEGLPGDIEPAIVSSCDIV